jgi:hypothetical protein
MGLRSLVVAVALGVASACGAPEPPARAERAASPAPTPLGSWNGEGSRTLGFVSESGSFRITWTAQNKDNAHPGSFVLTLRSGISGRTLKVIADHQSASAGSVEFGDDPRLYELVVDSTGITWKISVDETFTGSR